MEHPWMTFFIILGVLQTIVHIIALLRGKDSGSEL